MNIPTLAYLESAFYQDLAWRRKELSSLYLAAIGAPEGTEAQSRSIRAGIVLTYAHLEGFARQSIRAYFAYIKSRNLTYSQLALNFLALKLSKTLSQPTAKASYYSDAVELLTAKTTQVAELPDPDVISANSNLSFDQLSEMLYCVNLSSNSFETKRHFMNDVLLKRRNAIAHGEFRKPELSDYIEVHNEVLDIIDGLHSLLVESANSQAFRRTPPTTEPVST